MDAIRSILGSIRDIGCKTITGKEAVYWHRMMVNSFAAAAGVDTRDKGAYKPIIVECEDRAYMVEWDYIDGGWIVWDDTGSILTSGLSKYEALRWLYYYLVQRVRLYSWEGE